MMGLQRDELQRHHGDTVGRSVADFDTAFAIRHRCAHVDLPFACKTALVTSSDNTSRSVSRSGAATRSPKRSLSHWRACAGPYTSRLQTIVCSTVCSTMTKAFPLLSGVRNAY